MSGDMVPEWPLYFEHEYIKEDVVGRRSALRKCGIDFTYWIDKFGLLTVGPQMTVLKVHVFETPVYVLAGDVRHSVVVVVERMDP